MLPTSERYYFNRADFDSDLKRIQAFYADRGYPDARVTDVRIDLNAARDAVKLTVTIDEGAPVIVDRVRYEGFDVISDAQRKTLDDAPLRAGVVRDHDAVKTTRDQASQLFRNAGYPQIYIDAGERPSRTAGHVIISFRADPGAEDDLR